MYTKTTHTKDGHSPIITLDSFTYDHMNRLLTQTQKINDQDAQQLVHNTYDELGQLESKEVGAGLQKVDYSYNIRGWLTQINNVDDLDDDLFAFKINYTTATENLGANPLYNGNISETLWKTANDYTQRAYGYQYDDLNRIKVATSSSGNYNLSDITYDKNGNILSLHRLGHINSSANTFGDMDILTYNYNEGNQLLSVTDTGNSSFGFKDGNTTENDYEYDDNGNLIVDKNKAISDIAYNHLNLPTRITVPQGDDTGVIYYIYDATGQKLKKNVLL